MADGSKRAVLVGAGHAHLETIKAAGEFARQGFEIALVAPGPFWYSGLATGMFGGMYPPEVDRIDVAALIARGGGRFVEGTVKRIDAVDRLLHLDGGSTLGYDALSLDVGSAVPLDRIPGLAEHAVPVKPIENLASLRRELETSLDAGETVRLAIAGDGYTACELAGNALRLGEGRRGSIEVTLIGLANRVLPEMSAGAASGVVRNLSGREATLRMGSAIARVEPGAAITEDRGRHEFDHLIAAIGLEPSPLPRASGLPVDDRGALRVDEHLRCVSDPRIHGGGDCVAFEGRELPKIGVFAVRQAPVIRDNLLAALSGCEPRRFRPQSTYLLIMNLGDGQGLASWGPLHWQGRSAHWLKDRIDRRFLAKYRT